MVCCLINPVFASNSADSAAESVKQPAWSAIPAFKIGVESQDYGPFSWVENGEFKGLMRDLLDGFAKAKGYQFQYEPLPIPRLFSAFLNNQIDAKMPDHPNWGQELKQDTQIRYSQQGIPATNALLTLPGDEKTQLIRLKRVGTVLGFTVSELRVRADAGEFELYEVNNLGNLLKMLQKRHVRGIYFDANVARYYMRDLVTRDLEVSVHFAEFRFKYLLSSIQHPQLIDEFDAFIQANPEWFAALLKRYDIR